MSGKRKSTIAGPLFALALLFFLVGHFHGKVSPSRGAVVSYRGPVPSGTLSCTGLENLWMAAGGARSTAFLAAEVARAESAGREYATNSNTDGSTDIGYWQINNSAHPGMAVFDPIGNAKSAIRISGNGTDWHLWVTYEKGLE